MVALGIEDVNAAFAANEKLMHHEERARGSQLDISAAALLVTGSSGWLPDS